MPSFYVVSCGYYLSDFFFFFSHCVFWLFSIFDFYCTVGIVHSSFQIGLYKRVNAIADTKLMKLEVTDRQNDQTILCLANMARIALQMLNWFSSHQPVFELNPNFFSILKVTCPLSKEDLQLEDMQNIWVFNMMHEKRTF